MQIASRGTGLGYRAELDGIRAVAILAVMAFHSLRFVPRFHLWGGGFGVDLFFVLSGFLITTLLLEQHDRTGGIDVRHFYVRRARRLLPALIAAIALGGGVALYIGSNLNGYAYPKAAFLTVTYVGNWFETSRGELGLLLHTWSLAIEAQFYLVWPFAMLFALARTARRGYIAVVLSVTAFVLSTFGSFLDGLTGVTRSAVWTATKSSGLLIGSALAIAITCAPRIRRLLGSLALATAAALVGTGVVISISPKRPPQPWTLPVLIVCFATVIGHLTLDRESSLSRLARRQPLPAIGLISYGLYLYHFPINYLVHGNPTRWTGPVSVAVAWALTFVVAIGSYFLIERPIHRRRRQVSRPAAAVAPA